MVILSPLTGVVPLTNGRTSWLINRGDPNLLTGMIHQVGGGMALRGRYPDRFPWRKLRLQDDIQDLVVPCLGDLATLRISDWTLLLAEIPLSVLYIPIFTRFYTSQLVQDFSHQQYGEVKLCFSQGSFGSPNHQWLEIPWFLGHKNLPHFGRDESTNLMQICIP